MIRRFLTILAILLPMLAGAQTIHWLTFIDTTDPNVGPLDVKGREVLYGHFINPINAALAEKGYKAQIKDIYGKDLTPAKCRDIINSFKCGPDDIVMFYYIGHGTHGTAGGDVWPMMWMAGNSTKNLIPLKWVHDELKKRNPRLLASIGMCCNVYQDIARRSAPQFAVNYGNSYLTDGEKKAIQKMFLERKGDFILSSAKPGQSSLGGRTALGDMDIFTCVLAKNFEYGMENGDLDWVSLFTDVRDITNEITDGNQTPIFSSNIFTASLPQKAAPAPKPVQPSKPKTTSPSVSKAESEQDWMNIIGTALDNLIDTRQNETNRIAQAESLESVFAPGAVVRVMSTDGNQVIDKDSAEEFIGRLATSRILLKVVPVSIKTSGDRITEMRVKETYRK